MSTNRRTQPRSGESCSSSSSLKTLRSRELLGGCSTLKAMKAARRCCFSWSITMVVVRGRDEEERASEKRADSRKIRRRQILWIRPSVSFPHSTQSAGHWKLRLSACAKKLATSTTADGPLASLHFHFLLPDRLFYTTMMMRFVLLLVLIFSLVARSQQQPEGRGNLEHAMRRVHLSGVRRPRLRLGAHGGLRD